MHLTAKKRVEVFNDSKLVVVRDDEKNLVVSMSNNGKSIEIVRNGGPIGTSLNKSTHLAFAIYGLVELQVQNYLVIVTKAEFSANIADRYVYLATEFKFVPLGFQDPAEDEGSIGLFQQIFSTKSLYFSAEYDLTRPFAYSVSTAFKHRDHDERFYYNSAFVGKLRDNGLDHLVQPFVSGLIEQRIMNINQKAVNFIIISRRDKTRAGFRFVSRGSDSMGNVSNFAETEQIVSFMNEDNFDVYTYLQTRGSIPIIWKQTPNLSWSPKVLIDANTMKKKNVFENHMNKIKFIYKDNHLINLIDKKGSQFTIGNNFSELIRLYPDPKVKYTWFDFHAECAKMQWHNLSKLISQIQKSIQDYKYGHFKVFKRNEDYAETKVFTHQLQEGVFRTNCMDCLDRTNVVQSVIARNILLSQLHQAGVIQKPNGDPFEELPKDLEEAFREFWTDNANKISMLYTGTGALKTDFTRYGKRSMAGSIEDGKRAIVRYFLNTYYDSHNQNALDLTLGKIRPADLKQTSQVTPTSTLATAAAMLIGPYYLSALLLKLFGKTFNWSYFFVLLGLSALMSFNYLSINARKIWDDQILKD